jgi:hypothetical protein
MKQQGKNYHNLDAAQMDQIRQIGENSSRVSANARAIVNIVNHAFPYQGGANPEGMVTGERATAGSRFFSCFPNPANSRVRLNIDGSAPQDIQAELADCMGRVLLVKRLMTRSEEIDISNITPGVYQVYLQSNGKIFATQKLIIQK